MNLLVTFAICMALSSSISYGATYLLKGKPTQQDNKDFDSYANDTNSILIAHRKNGKYLEKRSVNGTVAEITSTMNDTLSKSYDKVIRNLAHIDEELKAKIIQARKLEDASNQKVQEIEEQRIAFQQEKEQNEKILINKTIELKNEADRLKKLESEIKNKTDQLAQKEKRINDKMKTKEDELKQREDEVQKQKSEIKKQKEIAIRKKKRNSDVETKLKNREERVKTKEEELQRREDKVQKQKSKVEKQQELAIQKEEHNSDIETKL